MNFRVNSLQPVAGATGLISRVQLPQVGRVAVSVFEQGSLRALPGASPARSAQHRRELAPQRGQHRAQCRAACMSKASF